MSSGDPNGENGPLDPGNPDAGAGRPRTGTPGDTDLDARRERLNEALKGRRPVEAAEPANGSNSTRGWGQALRMSSEFIAGVLIGGGVGWGFDWLFGTLPFGLIVFLLLGFAAGVVNVLRAAGQMRDPWRDGPAGRR